VAALILAAAFRNGNTFTRAPPPRGIDRKEAETYIRPYFGRYRGVCEFIDRSIAQVGEPVSQRPC
jgi:hypothetical protein